jgi:hypothetical protein
MKSTQIAVLALATSLLVGGCSDTGVDVQASSEYSGPLNARYQLDRVRGYNWWLTNAGVYRQEARGSKPTLFELPGWVLAGDSFGCPADLALGGQGEVVVTSNVISTLWRIDPKTGAVSAHPLRLEGAGEREIGFSGLVYSQEQQAFFAVSGEGVWKIDAALTRAEKVRTVALPEAVQDDRRAPYRARCLRSQRVLMRFAQAM